MQVIVTAHPKNTNIKEDANDDQTPINNINDCLKRRLCQPRKERATLGHSRNVQEIPWDTVNIGNGSHCQTF